MKSRINRIREAIGATQAEPLTATEGQLLFDMNLTSSAFAGGLAVVVVKDETQEEQIREIGRKVNPKCAVVCLSEDDAKL